MAWIDEAVEVTTRVEREARALVEAQEASRRVNIETAKETAGLKDVTIEQAENAIDNRLDGQTTVAGLREATRVLLKKMVPYILQ